MKTALVVTVVIQAVLLQKFFDYPLYSPVNWAI